MERGNLGHHHHVETNRSVVNEYKGDAGQSAELIIYRMGNVSQAGSVTISIAGVTAAWW